MNNTISNLTDDFLIDYDGPFLIDGAEDEKGDFAPPKMEDRTARPSHPGAVLRELLLPQTGASLTQLAQTIGVSRRTVSMIANESRPVTVDMAHRLARAFGTSSRFWLNLQRDLDDWQAHHERREEYERIPRLAA